MISNSADSNSVIGEECHIVSREGNGPRGNSPLSINERDDVDNLILLCRNHHKLIDDQLGAFTVDVLNEIKLNHETWVRNSLSPNKKVNSKLFFAFRVDTGTQLWNTVIQCDGYSFDIVQPETEDEVNLLGDFTQNITDYGDLWNVIENRDWIVAQFELDKQIKELNEAGMLVYATSRQQRMISTNTKNSMDFMIGYVLILRRDNPIVKRKDDEIETVMQAKGQTQINFSNYVPIFLDASYVRIA